MNFFEQHDTLTDHQHGFSKKQFCEFKLIKTITIVQDTAMDNTKIDAVLLDISKNFDKIPHKRLLTKFHPDGVRDHFLRSFQSGRAQRVLVEGHSS